MKSVYIREQKRYRAGELEQLLGLGREETARFLKKLERHRIVKAVRAGRESQDFWELEEEAPLAEGEPCYVFPYVGIVTDGERILKCVPKYLTREEPLEELKEVLKVLQKYESREQKIPAGEGDEGGTAGRLSLMLLLLEDYLEYGPYTNYMTTVQAGGSGEVLWEETLAGIPVLTRGGGTPPLSGNLDAGAE